MMFIEHSYSGMYGKIVNQKNFIAVVFWLERLVRKGPWIKNESDLKPILQQSDLQTSGTS